MWILFILMWMYYSDQLVFCVMWFSNTLVWQAIHWPPKSVTIVMMSNIFLICSFLPNTVMLAISSKHWNLICASPRHITNFYVVHILHCVYVCVFVLFIICGNYISIYTLHIGIDNEVFFYILPSKLAALLKVVAYLWSLLPEAGISDRDK